MGGEHVKTQDVKPHFRIQVQSRGQSPGYPCSWTSRGSQGNQGWVHVIQHTSRGKIATKSSRCLSLTTQTKPLLRQQRPKPPSPVKQAAGDLRGLQKLNCHQAVAPKACGLGLLLRLPKKRVCQTEAIQYKQK